MAGDDDATDVLGAPPVADDLARAVRKSRVANQLFGTDERVEVGRYHLLEQVGAGGIGVVWGAWDPELERRVAIKLLKPMLVSARERMLREGQALAKLSHPNVVPVYDVGVAGERVYIVMEWVRGATLRTFVREPRSAREIVAAYRAAGEGLDAAHRAGLVHRDFKPDNAVVGEDGRVRVLDFGLAREGTHSDGADEQAQDAATRGAGTPRYMAPEQADGKPLTPAADQYAFCVSLREALATQPAGIPSWLAGILDRGTSIDPAARFSTMRALLDALGHDPRVVWRRRALVATALILAATTFAIGSARSRDTPVCVGGDAEIAQLWNPALRARVLEHVRGLGAYGADVAALLVDRIDGYSKRWSGVHRATCLAHDRHELTDASYERNLTCLAKARATYATLVDVAATIPVERLESTVDLASGLPAIENCRDESRLPIASPPPAIAAKAREVSDEIERARVLAKTDDPRGLAATQQALAHARELDFGPLLARAYLANGHALLARQDAQGAIPMLAHASEAAIDAFDDVTFVEAFAREAYARVTGGQARDVETRYAEHVAQRNGAVGASARALLYNNIGAIRQIQGDRTGARSWFERAIAAQRTPDAELLLAYSNRALVADDPAERDRFFEEAHEALSKLLGENHRKTLELRYTAALFITDPARAEAQLAELAVLFARYHASVAPGTLSACAYELAWLREARGDLQGARAALQSIAADGGPLRETVDAFSLYLDGKLAEAANAARAVGDKYRAGTWERFRAADAYTLAAISEQELGHAARASVDAGRAVEVFDQLAHVSNLASYQRRRALATTLKGSR